MTTSSGLVFRPASERGWIPSNSAGYGLNRSAGTDLRTSQSWMVVLQRSNLLADGNSLGMGLGQPAFATATRNGAATESDVWAWEWWYGWQVSDAISVTPVLFHLNNPGGRQVGNDQFGALIKTSFQF